MPTDTYTSNPAAGEVAGGDDFYLPPTTQNAYEKAESALYRGTLDELKPFTKEVVADDVPAGTQRQALRFIFTLREVLETTSGISVTDSNGENFNVVKTAYLRKADGSPVQYYHSKKAGFSNPNLVDAIDELIGRQLSDAEAGAISPSVLLKAIAAASVSYKLNVTKGAGASGDFNRIESVVLIPSERPKIEAILKSLASGQEAPKAREPIAVRANTPAKTAQTATPLPADDDDPFADN